MVYTFSSKFNWNILCHSLYQFPCNLTLSTTEETLPPVLSLWLVEHSCNVCPPTAFSTWYWGNQFLHSLLVCHLLQTPSHCGSSLLDFTQYMNVFLGSPEPHLALTEWFYKCQTEGKKHIPEPAGYACFYSPVSKFSSLSLQYLYYLLLLSVRCWFFSKPLSPPWLPLLAFFMFCFSILSPLCLCPYSPPHYLPALFCISREEHSLLHVNASHTLVILDVDKE